ncbi:alpha/beta hydrolase [Alteromonas sp. CYL-A6]|uniref:alpha/beta hydrolase n=1 Tax=Alteromonas nitratireducens TaxID=3390813 RepID=UPI0034A8C9CB
MKRIITLPLLALIGALSGGCATFISYQINHFTSQGIDFSQLESQFAIGEYCESPDMNCVPYFQANPDIGSDTDLNFKLSIKANESTVNKSLFVAAEDKPRYKGTVLLLHGFAQSKNTMLASALYYRSLGFHVLIPDLPGHGDSSAPRGMGVLGALSITAWLSTELDTPDLPRPLYIVGYSMGAVTALHIARSMASPPNGLILFAPMQRLDKAAIAFSQLENSWYAMLFDEDDIVDGVNLSLNDKQINVHQTDSVVLLETVKIPTLVFASNTDPIAPFEMFTTLNNPAVKVLEVDDTPHILMLWLENWQHEALSTFFSENGQ